MSSAEGVLTDTDVARAILHILLNLRRCRDQLLCHKPANMDIIVCMSAVCMVKTTMCLHTG